MGYVGDQFPYPVLLCASFAVGVSEAGDNLVVLACGKLKSDLGCCSQCVLDRQVQPYCPVSYGANRTTGFVVRGLHHD